MNGVMGMTGGVRRVARLAAAALAVATLVGAAWGTATAEMSSMKAPVAEAVVVTRALTAATSMEGVRFTLSVALLAGNMGLTDEPVHVSVFDAMDHEVTMTPAVGARGWATLSLGALAAGRYKVVVTTGTGMKSRPVGTWAFDVPESGMPANDMAADGMMAARSGAVYDITHWLVRVEKPGESMGESRGEQM